MGINYANKKIMVVSSAVIRDDGKYLLVQSGEEKYSGKWGLPGGKLDFGEDSSAAIIREVREETGYKMINLGLFGVYYSEPLNNLWVVNFAYSGMVNGSTPKNSDGIEILDLGWFTIEEIFKMRNNIRTIDNLRIIADSEKRFRISDLEQIVRC